MDGQTSPLARQIAALIAGEGMASGDRLTERSLAGRFRVSRSPIRAALRDLMTAGILASGETGGHRVADPEAARQMAEAAPPPDPGEEVYLAIARDRLAGAIPERISENELLRRYGTTRPRLQALLRRMTEEGWAERLPGHGWQFLPVLTSIDSYRQSYRFRLAIEPAALLEPTFRLDAPLLERHLAQQERLVAGEVHSISNVQLFVLNSAMHEALIECSGNAFFIESLRRVDRLRRLIEYGLSVDRERARLRCAEHVAILEHVLDGRNEAAAEAMRSHLARLGPVKAQANPEGGDQRAAG